MERRHAEEVEAVRRLNEVAMVGNIATLTELLHDHPLLLHQVMVDFGDPEIPLHTAAMLGHTDFVRELLNRTKELALELDSRGRSPLHLASAKGYVEIIKMILLNTEPHSICELCDGLGRTPLHIGTMKGRDEVLKQLIDACPRSTRILTHEGKTILHLAVEHNRFDTLKWLLDHVEQVDQLLNSKDSDGNTLHLAVAQKQVQIVKYLVGEKIEGIDINAPNNSGCTPLDMLLQSRAHCRDMEIGEFLRDNGAIRGRSDMHSCTPLAVPSSMRDRSKKIHGHMVGSENWVSNMRNTLMVVASLIATVAFQALITPAGGLFQENGSATQNNMQYGYSIGRSVMSFYAKPSYIVYMTTNTLAFLCSLGIILLLISGFPLGRRLFMWVLMIIMWVSTLSLPLTYMIAAEFMTSYPGVPVPAEAPPPQMQNFYNEDTGISSHFEGIPILTFYVFWALLGVVLLGNLFRLIVQMVHNYIANKNQRRSLTSTTQDGNV